MCGTKVGDYVLSDSLALIDGRVRCADCDRWEYATKVEKGAKIVHSSRCDLQAQPRLEKAKPVKKSDKLAAAAKAHQDGYNVDGDTVFEAYQSGHLSMSDAMNSDF